MTNIKKILMFTKISEKERYEIYYTIASHPIKTGNEKAIMFVIKDDEIVYVPPKDISQFHMKRACDEFIEEQIMKG